MLSIGGEGKAKLSRKKTNDNNKITRRKVAISAALPLEAARPPVVLGFNHA